MGGGAGVKNRGWDRVVLDRAGRAHLRPAEGASLGGGTNQGNTRGQEGGAKDAGTETPGGQAKGPSGYEPVGRRRA